MNQNPVSNTFSTRRTCPPLTGEALRKAIETTPPIRPSLIEDILPEMSTIMVSSPPGQGKSCLLLTLIAHATTGMPVFKHLPCKRPLRIYVFCPERRATELLERLHRMHDAGVPFDENHLCIDDGLVGRMNIDDLASLNTIKEALKGFADTQNPPGIDLIAFEGMYGLSRKSLASDETANDFARFNAELQYNFNASLWYSHHTKKGAFSKEGDELPLVWFGSQMLMANVTGAYIFEQVKGTPNRCKMENHKDTVCGLANELIFDYDPESFTVELATDAGLVSNYERLRSYVNLCHRGRKDFTYADMTAYSNLSHSSIQRRVLMWVKEGVLENLNPVGKKGLYRVIHEV